MARQTERIGGRSRGWREIRASTLHFGNDQSSHGRPAHGNVDEERDDISLSPGDALLAGSVFLGVDTVLGPVYLLGYRPAEQGNDSIYLYLGRCDQDFACREQTVVPPWRTWYHVARVPTS